LRVCGFVAVETKPLAPRAIERQAAGPAGCFSLSRFSGFYRAGRVAFGFRLVRHSITACLLLLSGDFA
jgi:hypothetical protein